MVSSIIVANAIQIMFYPLKISISIATGHQHAGQQIARMRTTVIKLQQKKIMLLVSLVQMDMHSRLILAPTVNA
jgi:hypothetical protein